MRTQHIATAIVIVTALAALGAGCTTTKIVVVTPTSQVAPKPGGAGNDAGSVARRLVQALIDRDLSAYQRDYNPAEGPQSFPMYPSSLSGCQIKDVLVPGQLVANEEDVEVIFQQPCGAWADSNPSTGTNKGISVRIEVLNGRAYVNNWTSM